MSKQARILDTLFAMSRDIDSGYRQTIVSAIYIRSKLISYGVNEAKSHPFQREHAKNDNAIFWHSETKAIHNALSVVGEKGLKGSTIYIARARMVPKRKIVFGLAKPCCGCMDAIRKFGIARIVYTLDADDPKTKHYGVMEI